jgi:hypothetical protein
MTKHVMGRLSPLPTGFIEERTVVILRRLESDQIVLDLDFPRCNNCD